MTHTTIAPRLPLERAFAASDQPGWRNAVSHALLGVHVHDAGMRFTGSIRTVAAGGVVISRVTAGAHRTVRSQSLIEGGDGAGYMLCTQISGTGTIEQGGRSITLGPGDVSVFETDVPYELAFDHEFDCLGVLIPREATGISPGRLRQLTLQLADRNDPLVALVGDFARRVSACAATVDAPARERLFGNVVDLIDGLWMSQLRRLERENESVLPTIPADIIAFIETSLADPDLSPVMIAQAHYMSVRKLHGLFAREGITVAAWIRRRRLERCRDDLARGDMSETPIAEIAARWGLVNPPHFSQLFRATYGMTATAYRTEALSHG